MGLKISRFPKVKKIAESDFQALNTFSMPYEYERSHLCYMMKAHGTALRHRTRILSLHMQLLDTAEVLLGIRWSEQKLREKFLSGGSSSVFN